MRPCILPESYFERIHKISKLVGLAGLEQQQDGIIVVVGAQGSCEQLIRKLSLIFFNLIENDVASAGPYED